jgi:hypothetical protein
MIGFPELPSDEEMRAHQNAMAGELSPITVCQSCCTQSYLHRLGCKCGGEIKWLWQDRSGAILECGIDFSPLPDA